MSSKYALIIGNTDYQDTSLAQLKSPRMDAHKLADALQSPTIGAFDQVLPLVNETEAKIRRELVRFFNNKKPDDLLLLYFSGHGVRHADTNQLFLALKDTERALLSATAIPATFITEQMDICRSKRQVLILDCCHSGAFVQGAKGAVGDSVGTATAFAGTGFGRVVLTATDATQYAFEGDKVNVLGDIETSVFTHYLIRGLETGEADKNRDGWISLDEWYDYAYEHVLSQTPKQRPGKWSYRQQGDILIARNPVQANPADLPPELRQQIEDPLPPNRQNAVYKLSDLLRSHEPGIVLAAREALKRLSQDDSRIVEYTAAAILKAFEDEQKLESTSPLAKQPTARGGLEQKVEEVNRIVEQLAQQNAVVPFLRDRLNKWRKETAILINNEIGRKEALKFNEITAQPHIRRERERLLDVGQRCRQYLLSLL